MLRLGDGKTKRAKFDGANVAHLRCRLLKRRVLVVGISRVRRRKTRYLRRVDCPEMRRRRVRMHHAAISDLTRGRALRWMMTMMRMRMRGTRRTRRTMKRTKRTRT
jgi:hypothetical protein